MVVDRFSFSLTTFNKEGKLNQVEYATKAVEKNGETCIAIKTTNGCIIVAEKKPKSPLYIPESIKKIVTINKNIVLTFSGLSPDFNLIYKKALDIAVDYQLKYMEDITPYLLSKELEGVFQEFTQAQGVRPFGVSILVCGFQEPTNEFIIRQCDPVGISFGWKAAAIGENSVEHSNTIEKIYKDDITNEEAIEVALKTLNNKCGYTITEHSVEVFSFDRIDMHALTPDEIKVYVDQI